MHVCGSRTSKLAVVDVVLVGSGLSTRVRLRSWNKKNEIGKYEKKRSRLEALEDQIKNIKAQCLTCSKENRSFMVRMSMVAVWLGAVYSCEESHFFHGFVSLRVCLSPRTTSHAQLASEQHHEDASHAHLPRPSEWFSRDEDACIPRPGARRRISLGARCCATTTLLRLPSRVSTEFEALLSALVLGFGSEQ